MATFNNNESGSSVRTKINNVLQHMDGTSGEVVVNDAGADVDFRVESDTNANALFVDGGTGFVGIGTSSPTATRLHVIAASNAEAAHFVSTVDSASAGTGQSLRLITGSAGSAASGALLWHYSNDAGGVKTFRNGFRFFDTGLIYSDSTSERLRIDSSGNVGIGTTSPSSALDVVGNIEVSGGVYLGGTAAANLLDDYEEGAWTPSAAANANMTGTASVSLGLYRKVGSLVYVEAQVSGLSITATGAEASAISNLPFAMAANSVASVGSSFWSAPRSNGGALDLTAGNATQIFLVLPPELTTTSGATNIFFSLTYVAA